MKDFATYKKILKTFIEISFLLSFAIFSKNAYTFNFTDGLYSYSLYEKQQSFTGINCFRKIKFKNIKCSPYYDPYLVEDKEILEKNNDGIQSYSNLAKRGINKNVVVIKGQIINNSTNIKNGILKNTSLIKNALYSP